MKTGAAKKAGTIGGTIEAGTTTGPLLRGSTRPGRARRCLVTACAALLAASCAAATAIPGQPPSVTISRLADDRTGLVTAPSLELLAAYRLASRDPRFGGFSAVETDGRTLWLLSDRAMLWQTAMRLDASTGALEVDGWTVGTILPDAADRRPLDSEALALLPDGTLIAAFEHDDSVRLLLPEASGDWSTERLHEGRLIEGGPANEGIEALARLADGSILALSEGARLEPGIAAGARLVEGRVERFGYRTAAGFSPVGATATAGHLYVLERSVGVLAGWQTRLTRIRLPELSVAGVLEGEEILRINAGPLAENHEGIAILDREGEPSLILIVADDNQSALQRTLLLVFGYAG